MVKNLLLHRENKKEPGVLLLKQNIEFFEQSGKADAKGG
jgi:hypothetical protein